MNQAGHALGVLTGEQELRIGIEHNDIALLCAGVFIAFLLALIIHDYL